MAEYCSDGRYKIYRSPIWVPTSRYRAKTGRYIAVGNIVSLSASEKADLFNNKASNLLFVNSPQEAATLYLDYSIPKSRMIAGITPGSNLAEWFQTGVKRFYIDEPNPWHRSFGYEFVSQVDAQLPVDGKLYVSEYHHESCAWGEHGGAAHNAIEHLLSDYSPRVSTRTKLGTHSKWEVADYPWGTDTVTDPRYQWTQLKNALAGEGKFEFGWVPTLKNHYFEDFPRVIQWNRDPATN